MLFIKLLGILLLTLSAIGYGISKAMKYTKRLAFLRDCRQVMCFVNEQILYSRAELAELFLSDMIPQNARMTASVFAAAFLGEDSFSEISYLTGRDRAILMEFATGLGMSDINGQEARCKLLLKQISEQIDEAAEESNGKLRLYSSLGAGAGLCLALLLI